MKTSIAAGAVLLLIGACPGWEAAAGPMSSTPKEEPAQEDIRGGQAGSPQFDFKTDRGDADTASGARTGVRPSVGLQDLQRSLMAEAYNGLGADKDAAQAGPPKAAAAGQAPFQLPDPLLDLRKGIGEFLRVDEIDGLGRPLGLKNTMVTEWKAADAVGSELFSGPGSLSSGHDQGGLSQAASSSSGTAPSPAAASQTPAPSLFSGLSDAVAFIRDNRMTILTMALLTLAAVSMGRSRR